MIEFFLRFQVRLIFCCFLSTQEQFIFVKTADSYPRGFGSGVRFQKTLYREYLSSKREPACGISVAKRESCREHLNNNGYCLKSLYLTVLVLVFVYRNPRLLQTLVHNNTKQIKSNIMMVVKNILFQKYVLL